MLVTSFRFFITVIWCSSLHYIFQDVISAESDIIKLAQRNSRLSHARLVSREHAVA
jgi:hypothetical protein